MELVKLILTGGVGSAVVVGLFALLQWLLDQTARRRDRLSRLRQDSLAQRGEELRELNRKLDVLFLADRTILYDRIKHLAKSYITRGYVTVEELEDLNRMYQVYHDRDKLGGNGFLKDIMEKVNATLELRG